MGYTVRLCSAMNGENILLFCLFYSAQDITNHRITYLTSEIDLLHSVCPRKGESLPQVPT